MRTKVKQAWPLHQRHAGYEENACKQIMRRFSSAGAYWVTFSKRRADMFVFMKQKRVLGKREAEEHATLGSATCLSESSR